MPVIEQEVKTVCLHYFCDTCGNGEMHSTGETLLSNPPQYPHVCGNCGATAILLKSYPGFETRIIP